MGNAQCNGAHTIRSLDSTIEQAKRDRWPSELIISATPIMT
jgi:hypothetical protein